MSKKKGNLIEQYIDKAVLGIAVIVSLAILWLFILSSPNSVEYSNQKYGPGELDSHIRTQARLLEDKLADNVRPKPYTSKLESFIELTRYSTPMMSDRWPVVLPGKSVSEIDEDRIYRMPSMPLLADAVAENIRTVVYVPTEKVDHNVGYEMIEAEPGDLDVVSVQASFDTVELYKNFTTSFNGPRLAKGLQDAGLAKPIFAGVQLERQQKLESGLWSEWQEVPRSKVDNNRERFVIPDQAGDDVKNVGYLRVNFADKEWQTGILQPMFYDIGSFSEQWFPPVLHKEAVKEWGKLNEQALRDERLAGRNNPGGTPGMGMPGMGMPARGNTARTRRGTGRERTLADIQKDYTDMQIDKDTRFGQMREPLVVWAHDDTVKPDNVYRYRLRVGVFNPIVSKDWFYRDEEHFKNEVVLWSEYSNVTEDIEIDPMAYIFPLNVKARDGIVNIKVSKFFRGEWRGAEFDVLPGEGIGRVIERELGADERNDKDDDIIEIDYVTGSVLVDFSTTTEWTGTSSLRPKSYSEIIYTDDGLRVAHLPVDRRNWSKTFRSKYESIRGQETDKFEKLASRGEGGRRGGGMPGMGMPGMGMPGMGMPGMPGF